MTATATETQRRAGTFRALTVRAVDRLTDDAVAVTFDVPAELRDDYRFRAGQHLTVRTTLAGQEVRRTYSICAPATSNVLRIAVKRLAGGAFSAWVNDSLRLGDTLEVLPPAGRFAVEPDPAAARHYAAVVAGSGITPVLSIASTVLAAEPRSRVTIVYGNRTAASVMFLEELADLKDRWPARLQVLHVLSREPQESALLSGRIDAARMTALMETLVPAETVDDWFLCGPYDMVTEVRAALTAADVRAARVHTELFHVEEEPPPVRTAAQRAALAGASEVSVTLDGRTTSFRLAPDGESVLEALLRERPDAPYACKGGVCGTCRARLVSGTVAMRRNYALEPDELEQGFVLACQSRPTSPAVALDLDA